LLAISYFETEQLREVGSSSLEENTEDGPFFSSEGCIARETQDQLRAEYRTKGLYSFLLYGWNVGHSQSFTQDQSLLQSFVIDSYIRYINYVLVPFAKKEKLFVKSSYYVFPVGLLHRFVMGGSYYIRKHLPLARRLLEKDFWLIPHMNIETKHWSLVVICYPNVKEKTFFAILDSNSKSMALERRNNQPFVNNSQTFLLCMLALSKDSGKDSLDGSFKKDPFFNPELVWVNVPQQQEAKFDNSGHYLM